MREFSEWGSLAGMDEDGLLKFAFFGLFSIKPEIKVGNPMS